MAKELGLDRAPIEFQTFYLSHVLVIPPNANTWLLLLTKNALLEKVPKKLGRGLPPPPPLIRVMPERMRPFPQETVPYKHNRKSNQIRHSKPFLCRRGNTEVETLRSVLEESHNMVWGGSKQNMACGADLISVMFSPHRFSPHRFFSTQI